MSNTKTVRKVFFVWEFEKEEQWLNEMALSGWILDKIGFCTYHFIACEPGAYTVRLEMRSHDDAYLRFMEETGAEYVGRMLQWIYFRKPVQCGAFDLFSDLDSRIAHLDKIDKVLTAVGFANLVIGLANVWNPVLDVGWVNLLCATLLMYALGRIHGKKEVLQKDRLLRE